MRKQISFKTRYRIISRDKFTCQYCGGVAPSVELEVDHIKSIKDGGDNDDSNLITACMPCNRGKSCNSNDIFVVKNSIRHGEINIAKKIDMLFSDIIPDIVKELGDNHKRAIDEVAGSCKKYLLSVIEYCLTNKDVRDNLIPIPKLEPYLKKFGRMVKRSNKAVSNFSSSIESLNTVDNQLRIKLKDGSIVIGDNIEEAFANLADMKIHSSAEIKRLKSVLITENCNDSGEIIQ